MEPVTVASFSYWYNLVQPDTYAYGAGYGKLVCILDSFILEKRFGFVSEIIDSRCGLSEGVYITCCVREQTAR